MKTTKIILAVVFALLVAYDVAAYLLVGNNATISIFARDFASNWPIAGVAFGVITGHLFWPQAKPNQP